MLKQPRVSKTRVAMLTVVLSAQLNVIAAAGFLSADTDPQNRAAHRSASARFARGGHWAAQPAGAPQTSGGNQAGQVVNAIPDDVVDRQGAPSALPLKASDPVYWQDLVRTLDQGRVRIQLLDSSFLNIGVRSAMRIVQHDPQTQQTQLELSFGHLRGEVKSLTRSGGKFEIQTPTAVIGVVGTVFDVDATETTTRIHVLEGKIKVHHRNPKYKGEVVVSEGNETHVEHNAPPFRPTHAPEYKKEIQEAKEHRKEEKRKEKQQQKEQKRQEKARKKQEEAQKKQQQKGQQQPKAHPQKPKEQRRQETGQQPRGELQRSGSPRPQKAAPPASVKPPRRKGKGK